MNISLIGAVSRRNVAGVNGQLPWQLKEDLHYFKAKTLGCPIIMGRKTFETIKNPLPGRQNIVLSEKKMTSSKFVYAQSLTEALAKAEKNKDIFIVGGQRPWQEAMSISNKIYLTVIEADYTGDVYFPNIDSKFWLETKRETFFSEDINSKYSFLEYTRI